jgi:hypothetical protein
MSKNNKKDIECIIKDCLLIIVSIVWVGTIIINIFTRYDIPNSVEVSFTMILGYLLGEKTINLIRNKFKKRK